jgi:hypothetical protein
VVAVAALTVVGETSTAVGAPMAVAAPQGSDPSGTVQDLNGEGIGGATVTLFRSDTGAPGTFVQVPNGSPIMSPPNQNNPDTTGAQGQFGWSVVGGYYEVSAHAPACSTTDTETTAPIQVPPGNSNIVITLNCIQTAQQLQTLLAAVTGVGHGSSLAAKVKQIQSFVSASDNADACAVLGAFINQVNAQKGVQLTAAQAASFITQARSIEAGLRC